MGTLESCKCPKEAKLCEISNSPANPEACWHLRAPHARRCIANFNTLVFYLVAPRLNNHVGKWRSTHCVHVRRQFKRSMALLGRFHIGLCPSICGPVAPLIGHRLLNGSQLHPSSCPGARHRWQTLPRAQASDSGDGSRSSRRRTDSGAGAGLDPTLERAVPSEQRPVNELKQLRQATLYSWVRPMSPTCMHGALRVLQ